MTEQARRPRIVASLAWVLVFASPLVQGGTPRLGTFMVELLACLTVLAAVLRGRARGRDHLSLDPLTLVLFGFLTVAAAGLARAPYYHDAERCFLFIAGYVALFAAAAHPGAGGAARGLMAGLRFTALFQGSLALWQILARGDYQPRGTFLNANFLAGFLALGSGVFLADVIFPRGTGSAPRDKSRRFLAAAGFALCAAAVVASRSRGGILALAASCTLLLVGRFGTGGLLPVAVAAAGLMTFPNPFRQRILSMGTSDIYAWSRLDIWRSALRMIADHPLLGVGLGQYRFLAPQYAFPIEEHWARYAKVAENPHSEPLMLAAELGLPGVLALVLLAAATIFLLGRARRAGARPGGHWPLLVLGGGCLQALVDFSLHSPPVVLAGVGLLATWVAEGRREGWVPVAATLRARPLGILGVVLLPLYLLLIFRPLAGFHYFLKAGGVQQGLLHEKESLVGWEITMPERANLLLSTALRWDGDSAPYHSAMGSLAVKRYASTGDPAWLATARAEIGTAMALNPNNCDYPQHAADLAFSLVRRGEQGEEGLVEWRALMERSTGLCPLDARLRERYASQALAVGLPGDAALQYAGAVELEPCFLRARYGLGLALAGQGKAREARREFSEILERADACRIPPARTRYEHTLVDLDLDLVHDALELLNPDIEETTP